jgi:ubiquinone/menaquinone biosynthesis C-methylase UbiE
MNNWEEYPMSPISTTPEPPGPSRDHLHAMWSRVAPAWSANADFIDRRGAAISRAMLAAVAPRPGERVLELACGPGADPGLAAAPLVGGAGEVVVSDVAPEMVALAAARVAVSGHANVRACVLDLEQLDEPDASFDVVLCREGLMLVPDPERAAAEVRRVLRPGGRAAIAVWGPRAQNPWLATVFDAVSAGLGTPLPPPGVPHPFTLDDAGRLAAVLGAGGLRDVTVSEVPVPYIAASVDEWWQRTTELAGPLAERLATLPSGMAAGLRARAEAAIGPYVTGSGLEIPGVSLLALAHR